MELDAPYHPSRFVEAIDCAESAGYKLLIIDSSSDSWNGPGGCEDISEKDNGKWIKAKQANRRMTMRAAVSDMHIIWCFKAQPKVKVVGKEKSASGKQEFHDLGIQPVCEKNAIFPLLLVFSVDTVTHLSTVTKCHDDLWNLFPEPKLISKEDGDNILRWNQTAKPLEDNDQLKKRAEAAASQGTEEYRNFFTGITANQRKALEPFHEENKRIATAADSWSEPQKGESMGTA
jgi:hypothetical protein